MLLSIYKHIHYLLLEKMLKRIELTAIHEPFEEGDFIALLAKVLS